jgi:two-component system, OmpR family, sensor histidine kinase CiaH
MFRSARIRLTLWYLLIIFIISTIFSLVIFRGISAELHRSFYRSQLLEQRVRDFYILPMDRPVPLVRSEEDLEIAEHRIIIDLVALDVAVIFLSGLAGYFLAGRTLQPIELMVDEQNRFITDASHELRTPLTALKTTLEVSLRDKKPTPVKIRGVFTDSLSMVNNLQSLSDNLLELTQHQNGNGKHTLTNVSLKVIIQMAYEQVMSLAIKKEIKFHFKIFDCKILGNEESLKQLFIIFFDNAIKYSSDKHDVFVTVKRDDHTAVISVRDTGFGIPKNHLPHIFDRFYRADHSRSKINVTGFGLGLSIAKRIVEFHNGTVSVESIPEKGTEFLLKFPIIR